MTSTIAQIKQLTGSNTHRPLPLPRRTGQMALWVALVLVLILSDLLLTAVAFGLAYQASNILGFDPALRLFHDLFSLLLLPLWLLVFGIFGLYNGKNLANGWKEYSLVIRATTLGMMAVIIAGFVGRNNSINRWWLICAWLATIALVSLGRSLIRLVVYALRNLGSLLSPAIIVGACEESRILAQQFLHNKQAGIQVIGVVDDKRLVGTTWAGLPVIGALSNLEALIKEHGVQEVIIAKSALSPEQVLTLFKRFGMMDKINFRLSSGLYEIITTGIEVTEFANVPLTQVNKLRLAGPARLLKFLLDYFVALSSIILGAPLLILIAWAIKRDSPGPIIHKRRVLGANGKQFYAYKFRTMYVNGDEILAQRPALQTELAQKHKLKADPRVTPIGRFLRQTSLDELPQLVNVLKREMSMVGPRIISPQELTEYNQWDLNLLTIQPGITGLWQVSGRSDVPYTERVNMDMFYIRNWNLWLDLSILLRTIPVMIRGKGAY